MSQATVASSLPAQPVRSRDWLALNFALTVFVSAFLLFQIEPLISKFILPWFGGSPAVWTTCLLFFQVVLFCGYAYAHLSTRFLAPVWRVIVHAALLVVALSLLHVAPGEQYKPLDAAQPTTLILRLLSSTVGLPPYFALSATGPLLQAWFSDAYPQRSPYRLYALSNLGSLIALLSYPFVFEPAFDVVTQARLWSWLFGGFCPALRAVRSQGVAGLAGRSARDAPEHAVRAQHLGGARALDRPARVRIAGALGHDQPCHLGRGGDPVLVGGPAQSVSAFLHRRVRSRAMVSAAPVCGRECRLVLGGGLHRPADGLARGVALRGHVHRFARAALRRAVQRVYALPR